MEGGQWVTPREFDQLNRRMDGFEAAQSEMGKDVKALLAFHNREQGAENERKELLDATHDRGARKLAWSSVAIALLSGLYWVSDAVTKFMHTTPHR